MGESIEYLIQDMQGIRDSQDHLLKIIKDTQVINDSLYLFNKK